MARRSFKIPQFGRRGRPARRGFGRTRARGLGGSLKVRALIALVIALFALISYYGSPGDENEITGDVERVALVEESAEIQLGMQAAPQMVDQHGGRSPDVVGQRRLEQIGERLLVALDQYLAQQGRTNPYRDAFQFTLLADTQTVNAFALPGGPVFMTQALYDRLAERGEDAVAGVVGHEIGHVLARHSNKRMAKQGLYQGLAGAAGVLGGDIESARMAQMVSSVLSMRYGREHELESDRWGVRLLIMAGYDPEAMVEVMHVLDEASGGGPPEFLSTHPKPENRVAYIREVIEEQRQLLADQGGTL